MDGVLAGLGFGTLFVALSRVSEDAGLLPLALNQAVAGVAIVAVAAAVGSRGCRGSPGQRSAW